MKKTIIRTNRAPEPGGAYSQAVKVGDTVYVAGTCPFEIEGNGKILFPGDMAAQTRLVLGNIENILKEAGATPDDVVKVTSFIHDLDQFQIYNETYSQIFRENPPARSTLEVGRFQQGMCGEIECVAVISGK